MNKITVTIGICAYNEAENIEALLDSVISQIEKEIIIESIVVVSDGSTDETETIVATYKDPRVRIVPFPIREGKPTRMNYLLRNFNTDVLIFLDADILLGNTLTLEEVVKQFRKNKKTGLVGCPAVPLPPETFIENAVGNYREARLAIEHLIDMSLTAYSVQGLLMAVSKEFAKEVTIPHDILADDAFLYFSAKQKGYNVGYALNGIANFRSPQTLKDEIVQSVRHHAGTPQLYYFFPKRVVDRGYILPKDILQRIVFYQFITNPFGYILVKLINWYAWWKSRISGPIDIRWEVIKSSKMILPKINTR